MKNVIFSLLACFALGTPSFAGAIEFDMEDPKGVNNIVFLLDAPLESINGTATGITGKVSYDQENPSATKGRIVVAVDSLSVANPKMVEHMMGAKWMAQGQHPEMVFELDALKGISQKDNTVSATAVGSMTIKGTTKRMEVPVSLTYLEGMLQERQRVPGDLLVVRSNFSVSRSAFGINPGDSEDKVADAIELRLSLAGIAPE